MFKRLESLGTAARLMLAFGLVMALTGGLAGMSYLALARVQGASTELADKWMPAVGHMASTRAMMLEVREFEAKHARASDAGYMDEYEARIRSGLASVAKSSASFHALLTDAPDVALAGVFDKRWKEYLEANQKVITLGRAGKAEDAKEIGDGLAKSAIDDAVAALDKLNAQVFTEGAAVGRQAQLVYQGAKLGMLGFLGFVLVVSLALAVGITRNLLRQLGGEPRVAVEVARAVAGGDLTTVVPVKPGDSHSMMAALRDMQASLAGVVSTVRQGSEGVATASAEIAHGNNDLSQRTEVQASALQQTAASMGQLDATVKRNADSARHANELATTASTMATRGGDAVAEVVATMKGINDSSRQISDITGVIDSIAFQTNILALNAAVEAARAGEQGRGFAVVATEVRMLAQRSADAARQIKQLIAASVERVEQGSVQVNHAGDRMSEVVSSIQQVAQIVAEITAAGAQQSDGVRQVGAAVAQLDQTTQQNAALVEQSAAAAEGLKHQAEQLVQAVAVFRLRG